MSAVLGDKAWTAEVDAMRAAIAENQTARLLAEARADELQAQVELLEEQGLRHRRERQTPRRVQFTVPI